MKDEEDPFDEEKEKESVPVSIAVLKAKVRMLTYLFKNDLVSKHEFLPVKLIAYGLMAVVGASVLTAVLTYFLKR